MCYTNGMQVFGADDLPLQGGDTINYNNYWSGKVHPSLEMYLVFLSFKEISCYLWYKMERNYCMILTKQLILDQWDHLQYGMPSLRGCNSGKGCGFEG